MTRIEIVVKIRDSFGENLLTPEDGDRLHALIHDDLKANRNVVLDFDGIKVVGSAFLNKAIGRLYADVAEGAIKEHLTMRNISDIALFALKRVVANSKEYYSNAPFRDAVDASSHSALEA